MRLSDFDYPFDPKLIAARPLDKRDTAKMLVIRDNILVDDSVSDFVNYLNPDDLVIFNNTKVLHSRFQLSSNITINLDEQITPREWLAFAKPAKKLQAGQAYHIADDFCIHVMEKIDDGRVRVRLECNEDVVDAIAKYGQVPLPPYIEKARNASDSAYNDEHTYQTVFAQTLGSVAAPTAGLHFTDEILKQIKAKGADYDFVTLHVGSGTFLPIKTEDISDHVMHYEYAVLTDEVANKINRAKRVVAVGSTALRTLEGSAVSKGCVKSFSGKINLFIKPGYEFKIVDALLTNFHLPKTTLMVLVSAFCGSDVIKHAYSHAANSGYRFFSYGDACLMIR